MDVRALVLLVALAGGGCLGSDLPTVPDAAGFHGEGAPGRWPTSRPEAQGLDPEVLVEMEALIEAGEYGAISSLLVLRHGTLVYERYSDSWDFTDLHRIYSVTKSVTSLLMGIAHDEGSIPALGTPILDLFPEYDSVANPAGKGAITLEHVLQMRTGLEWDELSTDYTDPSNPVGGLTASGDWIKYVLDLPLAEPPGSRFAYNSGVSMLMAGALADRTGMSAEEFAWAELFGPLDITAWTWDTGPQELINSGWGLWLSPQDMAAIGQLVLQSGAWEGEQIVPEEWVTRSATRATRFQDGTAYGFQWWLDRPDGGRQPMAGWGYGGQFVVIIPSLDMVMISTAENFDGGGLTPYLLADFGYRAAGVTPP